MAAQAPFTAYIQLYPTKTGLTRWERIRELERSGILIQQALTVMPQDASNTQDTALNLAQPGGGQAMDVGRFGWEYSGVAVKPAFGSTPAQATVVGFYDPHNIPLTGIDLPIDSEAEMVRQTYPDTQVFHAGEVLPGPKGATPWANGPTREMDAEAKALKANIELYLSTYLPSAVKWTMYKIELRGVAYGHGGFTFPQ